MWGGEKGIPVSNEKQSPLSWSGSVQVAGVFPHLAVLADTLPIRTETGIGALMPWADKLWFITYVSSKRNAGGGTGLFTIDADLTLTKRPESVVGCYANRMIHPQSDQLIIELTRNKFNAPTGNKQRLVGKRKRANSK